MTEKQTAQRANPKEEKTMKTRYIVIVNEATYEFTTKTAAHYFAHQHNTIAVRVNF